MINDGEVLDEVAGLVQHFVHQYQRSLPEFDLEQELNLALVQMIRANPDKSVKDLARMTSTCFWRRIVDLFRKQSGVGGQKRPRIFNQMSVADSTSAGDDPVSLAAINEVLADLRGLGASESTVLDALLNPSEALIVTSRSKPGRVTVAMADIVSHYGIGLRSVRRAMLRIRSRLTSLVED